MAAKEKKPLLVPVKDMLDALRAVKDGADKGDMRKHIACVHVCSKSARKTPKGEDGVLDVVATNGHVIYMWRQRLKGATDRSFSLTNACVKRIVRELTDVEREYQAKVKEWTLAKRWKKEEDTPPKPKEPSISFSQTQYKHPIGTMRLDVVKNEDYPKYDKLVSEFKPRKKTAPPAAGICAQYMDEVCKNFQKITKSKTTAIRIEFDGEKREPDVPMMRFTHPGHDVRARQLTCLVMPVRV